MHDSSCNSQILSSQSRATGGCPFPGCDRTRYTEGHHIVHWADGGETKLSNLLTLCGFHHRLIHEGGFGLAMTDDGVPVFTRPDGRRIPECGSSSRGNFSANALARSNRERGLEIDSKTARCRWIGESCDYNQAIEWMQFAEQRARTQGCFIDKRDDGRVFISF
jgi:HNH endonuclease